MDRLLGRRRGNGTSSGISLSRLSGGKAKDGEDAPPRQRCVGDERGPFAKAGSYGSRGGEAVTGNVG